MNMMEEMMNKMMEQMMPKMMEVMMTSMMNSMVSAMTGTPAVAPAEAVPAKQETPSFRRLTAEDFDEVEGSTTSTTTAELGCWEGISKDGKVYHWYGWADPNTGKRVFPGKQLYHVNDFYLKRDYGAYHPGKTTAYKFKNGGLRVALAQYRVHTEVEPEDAKAFMDFMKAKEDKAAERAHDTEVYTDWCKHTK